MLLRSSEFRGRQGGWERLAEGVLPRAVCPVQPGWSCLVLAPMWLADVVDLLTQLPSTISSFMSGRGGVLRLGREGGATPGKDSV